VKHLAGEAPEVRRELGELWAFRARAEGNAAERFARLAAGLEQTGAPGAWIEEAREASREERAHEALCWSVARGFGVSDVPGLIASEVRGPAEGTRERVLRELVAICCISETLNVRVMAASLVMTRDPELRRVQKEILRDEVGHSALGWRYLERETSARERGAVGSWLPGMLGLDSRHRLFQEVAPHPKEGRLRELGCLPRRDLRGLFVTTLERRIFPHLEALGVPTTEARVRLGEACHGGGERLV
jgi:hypothetical protein